MLGSVIVVRGAETAGPDGIERAVRALLPECSRVLVLGGAERAARAIGAEHMPLPRDAGELLALTAALREAGGAHVAVLAADLVHPSSELVRYMQQICGSVEVVLPEHRDGHPQPCAALYHPALLRRAEGLLAAGERELLPLLELASVRRVTPDEVAKFGEPEELLARESAQSFM